VSSRKLVEVTARIVGVQNFEDSPTLAMAYVIRAFHALTQMSAMAISNHRVDSVLLRK
jgi:hypothetical protein